MPQQQGDNDDALTTVTVTSDTPADYVPPPAIHHQEKQGGKFCCCCCDYRRAVIILGCVTLTMGLMNLVFWIGNVDEITPTYDDDQLNEELVNLNDSYRTLYMLLEAMAVVFGAVSIMGAWTFSILGVGTIRQPLRRHFVEGSHHSTLRRHLWPWSMELHHRCYRCCWTYNPTNPQTKY